MENIQYKLKFQILLGQIEILMIPRKILNCPKFEVLLWHVHLLCCATSVYNAIFINLSLMVIPVSSVLFETWIQITIPKFEGEGGLMCTVVVIEIWIQVSNKTLLSLKACQRFRANHASSLQFNFKKKERTVKFLCFQIY